MNSEVFKPVRRPAERDAYCRVCEQKIERGEIMVSWHSDANRGMYIHLCLDCCRKIGEISQNNLENC